MRNILKAPLVFFFFEILNAQVCNKYNVPVCSESLDRDVIFLIDASASMNSTLFYGPMLDFPENLFCAFNPDKINRAALITFTTTVSLKIAFQQYTSTGWFDAVETVRSTPNLCCACCTVS